MSGMRVHTHYDPETRIRTQRVEGRVDLDELRREILAIYAREDIPSDALALWDFRATSVSELPWEGLDGMARLAADKWGGPRAAFVVDDTPADWGVARILESQFSAKNRPVQLLVFTDLDEARQWLLGKEPEGAGDVATR